MIAIVNFSKGAWYPLGQKRMALALKEFGEGSKFFGYQDYAQIGSPDHNINPYAFKLYAIEKVRNAGFDKVLFMDSSIYPVKSMQPIFDIIEKDGYFMEEAGHWAGTWCNENALKYFGLTRDEAMKLNMFSAGFIGLDFSKEITREFFARWKNAMLAGAFVGSWKDHRHDMTCGSIIAKQLNMNYQSGGKYLAYIGDGYSAPLETAICHLKPVI